MNSPNVIRPCTPQFQPQTTVNRIVTGATADNVYFLSGVHLYAMNAGTGALRWGLLICDARSRLSWEGEDLENGPLQRPEPAGGWARWPMVPHDALLGLAVQNGRVFVTSTSFTFALDADSGELLWEHYTRFNHDRPAVVGDTVYVPSGIIHALSTHDGSERWSYTVAWKSETSMPVIAKDTLYIGSYDNVVYALDCASGHVRWVHHTNGRVYVAPMVDQGVVYAGSMDESGDDWPRIFALDADSGQLLWKSSRISDTTVHLAVAAGVLYTSDWRTGLIGLDSRTGTVLWEYDGISGVSLLVQGQVLYAASATGELYAFDTQTHQLLWQQTVRPRAGAVSRMKLLGDELYVGFNGLGEYEDQFVSIHAINTLTGGEDWSATVRWNVSTLDLA
jgi:outer membrane protein assembly factor BamB